MTGTRPPLSVVVTAREGLPEVAGLLEAAAPRAREIGAEVVVAGGPPGEDPPAAVRHIPLADENMLRLRAVGIAEARGELIAIGEDHAFPRPEWWEAVIRAHAENPDAAGVVGCLVNATAETVAGRGNFLAFAALWQPPMPELPTDRPPPMSAMSFKRWAVEDVDGVPGKLESLLVPAMFERGELVADERIVVDHYQDHGLAWSVRNGFHNSRCSYGYLGRAVGAKRRRETARWLLANRTRRTVAEARSNGSPGRVEMALVRLIGMAGTAGGIVGTFRGPGRSPALTS